MLFIMACLWIGYQIYILYIYETCKFLYSFIVYKFKNKHIKILPQTDFYERLKPGSWFTIKI